MEAVKPSRAKKNKGMNKKDCKNCEKRGQLSCPQDPMQCYVWLHKPHFEKKRKKGVYWIGSSVVTIHIDKKPCWLHRFLMKTLLDFRWEDYKDTPNNE